MHRGQVFAPVSVSNGQKPRLLLSGSWHPECSRLSVLFVAATGLAYARILRICRAAVLGTDNPQTKLAAATTLICVLLAALLYYQAASPLDPRNGIIHGLIGVSLQGLLFIKMRRPARPVQAV